jgi:hypothetical protein
MSIHILNLLIELSDPQGSAYTLDSVIHALGHTDAGNALDYNDYRALVTSKSINEFEVIARTLVPKYRKIHQFLGCPKNADAWTFAQLRTSPRTDYQRLLWNANLPAALYWRT